jgi:hypothetical protein
VTLPDSETYSAAVSAPVLVGVFTVVMALA